MSLNRWTDELLNRPLKLMRSHPVKPPSAAEAISNRMPAYNADGSPIINTDNGEHVLTTVNDVGFKAEALLTDGAFSRFFTGATDPIPNGDYKQAKVYRKIGNIRLDFSDPTWPGALTFDVKINPSADRIPCFFLPWFSKTLVHMVLPELKAGATAGHGNPDLFFTAAINGCSVFVTGGQHQPRVVHGGIDGGSTPYGDDAAGFWRDLVLAARAANGQQKKKMYEINKKDYVNQSGIRGETGTKNSDRYKRFLDRSPATGLQVESVEPWGCVFGIRKDRLWTFYLQENVTINRYRFTPTTKKATFQRLVAKKSFFGKHKGYEVEEYEGEEVVEVREENPVCKTMLIRPFFPAPLTSQKFRPKFRRV